MQKNIAIMVQKMHDTGVARVAANLSRNLSDQQYKKNIISYDTSNISYQFKGEIENLNTKEKGSFLGKLMNFIKRIYQTSKIKKSKKFDVTVSFQHSANLINILTKKNDKIIISIRSFISKDLRGVYGYLYKKIIKYMYNRADKIVSVSEAIKEDLINNFGIYEHKIDVIYNFYNIEEINKLASESILEYENTIFNHPVIITSGRLVEQKGQWHLLRAFKQVKETIPNSKLVILGQGYLEEYLKELSKDLDVDNDVHFLGFQSNPFKYIANADVYVFPSLYEGFPNALCEAMACGIPVISSDCESGPREILEPSLGTNYPHISSLVYADYGVLVPTCDGIMYDGNEGLSTKELLLAEAVVNLLKDQKKLKDYQLLSKKRIKDFKVNEIIRKWEKVINL